MSRRTTLLSRSEYESLMETLDILRDPELVREILDASAEISAGMSYTLEEVEAEMRANGRLR